MKVDVTLRKGLPGLVDIARTLICFQLLGWVVRIAPKKSAYGRMILDSFSGAHAAFEEFDRGHPRGWPR